MPQQTPNHWQPDPTSTLTLDIAALAALDAALARDHAAQARAEATLDAAAPDLLEALVMVRDADEDCKRDGLPTIPPAARAKIDAAIAKAEKP